jgi:hypothetical protein
MLTKARKICQAQAPVTVKYKRRRPGRIAQGEYTVLSQKKKPVQASNASHVMEILQNK